MSDEDDEINARSRRRILQNEGDTDDSEVEISLTLQEDAHLSLPGQDILTMSGPVAHGKQPRLDVAVQEHVGGAIPHRSIGGPANININAEMNAVVFSSALTLPAAERGCSLTVTEVCHTDGQYLPSVVTFPLPETIVAVGRYHSERLKSSDDAKTFVSASVHHTPEMAPVRTDDFIPIIHGPIYQPSCGDDENYFGSEYFDPVYCSDEGNAPEISPTGLLECSAADYDFGLNDGTDHTTPADHQKPHSKQDPIYNGAPINAWESLAAILSFVQSVHSSGAGLGRLLSLIDLHLPQPNNFMKTKHTLLNLLESLDEPVNMHYYCTLRFKSRKSITDLCDTCSNESRGVHFFIQFPLAPQLTRIFRRPGFKKKIEYKQTRIKLNHQNIEDIFDGEIYKAAAVNGLLSPYEISLMWNSDGIQIFNSTSYSLRPFYLVINELAPDQRHLSENLLIAGLWGSASKPHPNLFLSPMYKDLKSLQSGIEVMFYGEEEAHKIRATVLCGTCDAPARAGFLNMKSHSGFYSCHLCLIKGEKPGDSTVFPHQEDVPLRNMPDYREHVKLAVENKIILSKNRQKEDQCFGIKGPTILSSITPNLLSSVAVDSMHCIYLGIMRQLLHLWFDTSHKEEPFSVNDRMKMVNQRLTEVLPPHLIQRLPQPIEKLCYWKATELRSFLFNLSLVVLSNILAPGYYNHLALFVQGVSLINTASISEEDMLLSETLLNQFVMQFAVLYGVNNMTYNLHMLLHLVLCVRNLGPLWAVSCFPFEDVNGRIKNFVHGTRHVGLQVVSNLSIITQLPVIVHCLKNSQVQLFCNSILKKRSSRLKLNDEVVSGVYCIGVFNSVPSDQQAWISHVLERNNLTPSHIQLFHRLLKYNLLYVCMMYFRGDRVSCFVRFKCNNAVKTGIVMVFAKLTGVSVQYVALIKPLQTVPLHVSFVHLNHILKCPNVIDINNLYDCDVIDVADLESILFKVECDDFLYLSEPLNKSECQ